MYAKDNNSGKLQTIFWDGAGLKEELLGVHNTGAIIELMRKLNTESCQSEITITSKQLIGGKE